MPHHEIHEKKKTKNYALFAVIVSIIALFFIVTIVKFQENTGKAGVESVK